MISCRPSRSSRLAEAALAWGARGAALVAGGFALLVTVFLVGEASPLLGGDAIGRLARGEWQPGERLYGLVPMVAGSLVVTTGALLIALPLGVLTAVFLRFYAPPSIARAQRRLLGLLAGVPSVVFGLWGLGVVVPLVRHLHPPGPNVLAAALVLALMVVPTLAVLTDGALGRIPATTREGAAALALSRPTFVWAIALPAARSGIASAAVLAAGRALGETMAVLMVAGNVARVPTGPFDPVRTLTANVALEMAYALGEHRAALFASGLALLVVAVVLALGAEGLASRRVDASA